jgi:hypothetical protein
MQFVFTWTWWRWGTTAGTDLLIEDDRYGVLTRCQTDALRETGDEDMSTMHVPAISSRSASLIQARKHSYCKWKLRRLLSNVRAGARIDTGTLFHGSIRSADHDNGKVDRLPKPFRACHGWSVKPDPSRHHPKPSGVKAENAYTVVHHNMRRSLTTGAAL